MGFAAVAFLLPGRRVVERVVMGAGLGLGQYGIGLLWVHEFSLPGCVALIALSSLYAAVALALIPTGRRPSVVVGMPSLLLLADWARDRYPFGGLPIGGASLGQAAGPLAPTLRIGGSLLLTGETVLVGVALAELVHWVNGWRRLRSRWSSERPVKHALRREGMALAAVAAMATATPVIGWSSPSGDGGHAVPLKVALVQGGGPRGTRAIATDPQTVFQRHLVESENLSRPLDLVVWPEGVLQSHEPFAGTAGATDVADLAASLRTTLLVGIDQDEGRGRYVNEVVAWGPNGKVVASYQKNHLVPFGEYIPFRSLLEKFFDLRDVPYDGIPGHSSGLMSTPAGPLGVMISYEVFFDERARGAVRAGGQVLVVPTDTASYRSSQVPTQEVAADRLRAWETGRWVLQVTPTGYTAVISPVGRLVSRSALDRAQIISATIPMETGSTWYVDLGDDPVAIAALLAGLLAWLLARGDASGHHRDRWSLHP